jgi:CheY-like chemotaxis protein
VLLVEDDPEIRALIQEALNFEGFSVHAEPNGQSALDYLAQAISAPELILLDLMMPVMDGWQFLEAKEKSEKISNIPVLVVTAASAELPPTHQTQGILKKPIDLNLLLQMVQRFCQPSRS